MFRCQSTGFIQSQFTNLARHLCVKPAAFVHAAVGLSISSIIRYAFRGMEFGFNLNTDTSYQLLLADRVARCINRFRVNRRELLYVSAQKFILERRLQLGNLIRVRGNNVDAGPPKYAGTGVSFIGAALKTGAPASALNFMFHCLKCHGLHCLWRLIPSDLSRTKLTKMLKINDWLERKGRLEKLRPPE